MEACVDPALPTVAECVCVSVCVTSLFNVFFPHLLCISLRHLLIHYISVLDPGSR